MGCSSCGGKISKPISKPKTVIVKTVSLPKASQIVVKK